MWQIREFGKSEGRRWELKLRPFALRLIISGLLCSRVFPGLRLPVVALLAGDAAKVLSALTD